MNYYEVLRIAPSLDQTYIGLSARKEVLLQYEQEYAGDRSRLNEIQTAVAFLSRNLYPYYDFITNPQSPFRVPEDDLCRPELLNEPDSVELSIRDSKIYLVEMESFAILTAEKICYVYSREGEINNYDLNHFNQYYDVDSLFADGVSDCMILILQGTAQTPFKAMAHIVPQQNLHIVHARLIAAIEAKLGTITGLNTFIFGGAPDSVPMMISRRNARNYPLVEKESLVMNRPDTDPTAAFDKYNDSMTIILDTNRIYVEQNTFDKELEPITNFFSQEYNMQSPLLKLDSDDTSSELSSSPSP